MYKFYILGYTKYDNLFTSLEKELYINQIPSNLSSHFNPDDTQKVIDFFKERNKESVQIILEVITNLNAFTGLNINIDFIQFIIDFRNKDNKITKFKNKDNKITENKDNEYFIKIINELYNRIELFIGNTLIDCPRYNAFLNSTLKNVDQEELINFYFYNKTNQTEIFLDKYIEDFISQTIQLDLGFDKNRLIRLQNKVKIRTDKVISDGIQEIYKHCVKSSVTKDRRNVAQNIYLLEITNIIKEKVAFLAPYLDHIISLVNKYNYNAKVAIHEIQRIYQIYQKDEDLWFNTLKDIVQDSIKKSASVKDYIELKIKKLRKKQRKDEKILLTLQNQQNEIQQKNFKPKIKKQINIKLKKAIDDTIERIRDLEMEINDINGIFEFN